MLNTRLLLSSAMAGALLIAATPLALAQDTSAASPLDSLQPVTDDMLKNPDDGDWLMWRRTYDGWGYSPLDTINKDNVKGLDVAWTWSLTNGATETTPIVHDGVLFIFNYADKVQALNAKTGDLLWEYKRDLPQELIAAGGNSLAKRNMAIYGDNLILASSDAHIIALDAKTGQVAWDKQTEDWSKGWRYTSGPFIADGTIIQGMTGCGNAEPGGCFVTGNDPNTGEELWRVYTIARPDTEDGKTWNGLPLASRMGASAWISGSYDPEQNLVFQGVGQPYPWIAEMRGTMPAKEGEEVSSLYSDSTLAIEPKTGKLAWHHQYLKDDTWDLDYVYERQLIDLPYKGEDKKMLVTTGKLGIIEAIDRTNGDFLWAKETVPQNVVSGIDEATGEKTINQDAIPHIGETTVNCPADPGGRGWPATAYSPKTETLYLPLNEFCSNTTPQPVDQGQVYTGGGRATFARVPVAQQRRQYRPDRRDQDDRPVDPVVASPALAADQRRAADGRRPRLRRHLGPLVPGVRRRERQGAVGDPHQQRCELVPDQLRGGRQAVHRRRGRQRLQRRAVVGDAHPRAAEPGRRLLAVGVRAAGEDRHGVGELSTCVTGAALAAAPASSLPSNECVAARMSSRKGGNELRMIWRRTRIGSALAGLAMVLAGTTVASAQGTPYLPDDWKYGRREDNGTLRYCIDPRDPEWTVANEIAKTLADALLLTPAPTMISDKIVTAGWTTLYQHLRSDCDVYFGFKLIPGAYPGWLALSRSYYDASYVLAVTAPGWGSLADIPPDRPVGTAIGTSARLHLHQVSPDPAGGAALAAVPDGRQQRRTRRAGGRYRRSGPRLGPGGVGAEAERPGLRQRAADRHRAAADDDARNGRRDARQRELPAQQSRQGDRRARGRRHAAGDRRRRPVSRDRGALIPMAQQGLRPSPGREAATGEGIVVAGLSKRYGRTLALDGIDLTIGAGELFALLGPNGAGKSTLVHILTTILAPDAGSATVAGYDVVRQPLAARRTIGVVFQEPSLDDRLTVAENLEFHGLVYGVPRALRRSRITELLALVELSEWRDRLVRSLSSGMKRRLEIARALIHDAKILFLDEPTVGLDVQSRERIWGYLAQLKAERGLTLVVTTHYIEEVEDCDRVCIIDHGHILAVDTPRRAEGGARAGSAARRAARR